MNLKRIENPRRVTSRVLPGPAHVSPSLNALLRENGRSPHGVLAGTTTPFGWLPASRFKRWRGNRASSIGDPSASAIRAAKASQRIRRNSGSTVKRMTGPSIRAKGGSPGSSAALSKCRATPCLWGGGGESACGPLPDISRGPCSRETSRPPAAPKNCSAPASPASRHTARLG
jgi:hypothetical protein